MATRIRLRRVGRKKQPEYRIVVTDRAAARDGRFIETLGYYRPRTEPAQVEVDGDRARAWLEKGATPSDTVTAKSKGVRAMRHVSTVSYRHPLSVLNDLLSHHQASTGVLS